MHCYPARVITPDRVWAPATAQETTCPGEFIVTAKDGRELAKITDATVTVGTERQRELLGTDRVWSVAGNLDGTEPVEWLVMFQRGCGCGSTGSHPLSGQDSNALATLKANA